MKENVMDTLKIKISALSLLLLAVVSVSHAHYPSLYWPDYWPDYEPDVPTEWEPEFPTRSLPTMQEVESAMEKAKEINLQKRELYSLKRSYQNQTIHKKCPLLFHHGTRERGEVNINNKANDAILAVRVLMEDGGYSMECLQQNSVQEMFRRVPGFSCDTPRSGTCNFGSRFRKADGSCNNRRNPEWGMAGIIQQRVVPNDYDDKLGSPRTKGIGRKLLPNPRTISNRVHCNPSSRETLSDRLTLHVMGFGQFVDHDIAQTPEQDEVPNCCDGDSKDDIDNCFSIIIPRSFYETSSIFTPGYCMELHRSAPLFCPDATSKGASIRQQTNSLTSFVDASNVYGSSASRQAELREDGSGFRMKTTIFNNRERLPNGPSDTCTLTNASQSCSAAGDGRVNEVPTLTSYHFLFVKEHNRIAETLQDFYDDDETIFQETRRIVIAIMQKIVYDEFLPSFFSPGGVQDHRLQSSVPYVYEPNTDPTMLNAFGIAFRVGHTWVPQRMRLFSRSLQSINTAGFSRKTEDVFNNPDITYLPDSFERLAYYLSGSQSPETDSVIEEAVRSLLFLNLTDNTALDLAALNIQRARDHGLPSYNEYREWCGLSSVLRKWYGNAGLVDHKKDVRWTLQSAGYSSPRDIDLFVGGLTERPLSGGNLGPTFECIIGRQFYRLKFGDRLWYQNEDAGFTRAQIAAIQRYTLSKMLCNNYNFDNVHYPSAFVSRNTFGDSSPGYDGSGNNGWGSGNNGWGSGNNGWGSGGNGYRYFDNWYPGGGYNRPSSKNRVTLTSCSKIPDLDLTVFRPQSYTDQREAVPDPNTDQEGNVGEDDNSILERLWEYIKEN